MAKYNIREDYFNDIDSEEKAYFLGLLASDGCVTDEDKVLIGLQERDTYLIDHLKKALEYTGPIYEIKARSENHQTQRRLQFKNSAISASLNRLGIYPRKSLTLKFPDIDEQFISHFIRGYFDGDGCMRMSKGVLNYKFVGTFNFLKSLQDILISKCGVKETKMYQANKDKNTWELSYAGDRQCIRIYGFLYKNATVYLLRKKEKARVEITDSLNYYPSFVLEEELSNRGKEVLFHIL